MVAKFVGGAVDCSAFNAAARHPDGETVRVVIPSIAALGERSAAKFARPNNEGFVEKSPGLEIFQQTADGLIDLEGHIAVTLFQSAVLVPGIGLLAIPRMLGQATQFNKSYPPFHQPPCKEALPSIGRRIGVAMVQGIERFRRLGLAPNVAEFGHGRLHSKGRLVVGDGGFYVLLAIEPIDEIAIQRLDEVEPFALVAGQFKCLDVAHGFHPVSLKNGPLVLGGEVAVAEETDAAMGHRAVAALKHHKAWQVIRIGAEAIVDPGTRTGASHKGDTRVEEIVALGVLVHTARHGADHCQLVYTLGDVGEETADRDAAFTVLLEFKGRSEDITVLVELGALYLDRHGLAMVLIKSGFGVETILR